ncbi:hypothetical protein BH24DEI2_BH24DEI2_11130 [soil metagenome]
MSLDDLFSLLLFALFIGVPLLSRFLRRGPPTGTPPPTTQTGRTGLPTTPPTQTSQTQRRDTKNAPETAANDIGERLEQARRRVREAVEGQTARTDTRSARGTAQNPTGLESAGDMFQQPSARNASPAPTPLVVNTLRRPENAQRPRTLQGSTLQGSTLQGSTLQGSTLHGSTLQGAKRRATRPLQVERSLTGKGAKLPSEMLTFSREDIMRGIIWQQILNAPRSKRPWRNPSQHP